MPAAGVMLGFTGESSPSRVADREQARFAYFHDGLRPSSLCPLCTCRSNISPDLSGLSHRVCDDWKTSPTLFRIFTFDHQESIQSASSNEYLAARHDAVHPHPRTTPRYHFSALVFDCTQEYRPIHIQSVNDLNGTSVGVSYRW